MVAVKDKKARQQVRMDVLRTRVGGTIHTKKMWAIARNQIFNHPICDAGSELDRDELLDCLNVSKYGNLPTPDGIAFVERDGVLHVCVFEIADSCPLDQRRLLRWADLWWDFDATGNYNLVVFEETREGILCELLMWNVRYSDSKNGFVDTALDEIYAPVRHADVFKFLNPSFVK